MIITLKLFAILAFHLPSESRRANQALVEVPDGATVQEVVERFRVPPTQCALTLVNGVFIQRDAWAARVLEPGDVLAIWPPVGGG
jgi:thiamine biosynthesis protein ThiS